MLQLQPLGCASMSPEQLRSAGQLPLRELRLDSQAFRKASVNRDVPSHLDDRGVRALVDSICQRWSPFQGVCLTAHCSWHLPALPTMHSSEPRGLQCSAALLALPEPVSVDHSEMQFCCAAISVELASNLASKLLAVTLNPVSHVLQ